MRARILGMALAASGLIAGAAGAQVSAQGHDGDLRPTGKGGGVATSLEKKKPKPPPPPVGNGINYHNGPVMLGTVHVYYIWYGNWADNDSAVSILTDEAENIGGTPWFGINTSYYSGSGRKLKHVGNSVTFNGSTTDDYSHGTSLTDSGVAGVVADAITSGRLPKDPNGVYFVLTSADVEEPSGFCGAYCGWHTSGKLAGTDIKYAFVGNSERCPSTCTRLKFRSPNGNIGADGMASILAHELSESVTDPDLNAWYSGNFDENADKCAWTFGDIYTAPNGAGANVQWGPRDFLIQQNWVNAGGGYCALSYP
jgi:hypothetical protein